MQLRFIVSGPALSPAGLAMSLALVVIGLGFLYAAYGRSRRVQVLQEAH